MKYLYGASVQGIQSFIFETNKLKEIVGASELVEQICTTEFGKFCKEQFNYTVIPDNFIVKAAGNLKYIVDENVCEKIAKNFPKHISNFAPGITISQAAVKLTENIKNDIDKLEKLLKIQRNKVAMPIEIGFMGLERARRTGKVGFEFRKNEVVDRGTTLKQDEINKRLFVNFTGKSIEEIKIKQIPYDIENITKSAENSWLAIIHADGNGLGKVLQNLPICIENSDLFQNSKPEQQQELQIKVFRLFSEKLETATKEAAQIAFNSVLSIELQEEIEKGNATYPMRPVVLGGDDLTIIIRADLAYNFTKEFLRAFEIKTEEHFAELKQYGLTKLTACAGIAYIKDSYPFHYGVDLAESLTKEAKKFSRLVDKDNQPSSLSFYKVQSSFTDELKEMKMRTHEASESNVSFDYGPYLLTENGNFAHIGELDNLLVNLEKYITDKTKGISKLRQWISELHKDKSKAQFMLNRIKSVNKDFYSELKLVNVENSRKIIYNDLIQLHTFKNLYHGN
jgi:hypothetical protein